MVIEFRPPAPVLKRRNTQWPLAAVTVGKAFVVTDRSQFHACRQAVSRYNKQHGTNVQCTALKDGTMQVSIADDVIELTLVQDDIEPSKDQFTAFLVTLTPGMSVTVRSEHTKRSMDELDLWVSEFADESQINIESSVMADGSLTIRRIE